MAKPQSLVNRGRRLRTFVHLDTAIFLSPAQGIRSMLLEPVITDRVGRVEVRIDKLTIRRRGQRSQNRPGGEVSGTLHVILDRRSGGALKKIGIGINGQQPDERRQRRRA